MVNEILDSQFMTERVLFDEEEYDFSGNWAAVIDTETNYSNQVISIGVTIVDADEFAPVDRFYFVIVPDYKYPAAYADCLRLSNPKKNQFVSLDAAIGRIKLYFEERNINKIYAYNAPCDRKNLPQLNGYEWYDVVRIAAYRQYNKYLPDDLPYFGTGRLKKGYKLSDIYKYVTGIEDYTETHNAEFDSYDTAIIMAKMNVPQETYEKYACLDDGKSAIETGTDAVERKVEEDIVVAPVSSAGLSTVEPEARNCSSVFSDSTDKSSYIQVSAGIDTGLSNRSVFDVTASKREKTTTSKQSKGVILSDEQKKFIAKAKLGKNILVDACIGSGKTTSIQVLCNTLGPNKNILYLTYNRLLKFDAKGKIHGKNITVTNYDGFAYASLNKIGVRVGVTELIVKFNEIRPNIPHFDVLIIDEYQDIREDMANMLEYIKEKSPGIQIIAVGDADQKIYDFTRLRAREFITRFLGKHEELKFSICFRLNEALAADLGDVWGKEIKGVNTNCRVDSMDIHEVIEFLSHQKPGDVLCLGKREGKMSQVLNELESRYPKIYNKNTTFASIRDGDGLNTRVSKENAIFTTFDSSKGLERKICVLFDFTMDYWKARINVGNNSKSVIRNIFCVAASRGKERIIIVDGDLTVAALKNWENEVQAEAVGVNMSEAYEYKMIEHVEDCFSLLDVTPIETEDHNEIPVKHSDGLIDLSPCIGIYQEAMFFDNYDIDREIELLLKFKHDKRIHVDFNGANESVSCGTLWEQCYKHASLEKKILFMTMLETSQVRYITQVELPFVDKNAKERLCNRLLTEFRHDEIVQSECELELAYCDEKSCRKEKSLTGLCDVRRENTIYELKFVSELQHTHFLQLALYMIALDLPKGILWNTFNNQKFEVRIKDRDRFMHDTAVVLNKDKVYGRSWYLVKETGECRDIETEYKENTVSPKKSEPVAASIVVGTAIYHKKLGRGTVLTVKEKDKMVDVKFSKGVSKTFIFPEAFLKGTLVVV